MFTCLTLRIEKSTLGPIDRDNHMSARPVRVQHHYKLQLEPQGCLYVFPFSAPCFCWPDSSCSSVYCGMMNTVYK